MLLSGNGPGSGVLSEEERSIEYYERTTRQNVVRINRAKNSDHSNRSSLQRRGMFIDLERLRISALL